ncbi:1-acyl-sn-glycerol-3-phosphate acyltransferase [Spirochaeta lutea]|uniref:1-acyl-sn-glycerol-3-phosphate acyltransferase n=1 Tax=Spirochaeta lutea TaxID=1480694 RepID=UPI0012E00329|nr:1-acyl-sn-glycerol-3-phosphate acyltransferase [Spirochaeta lutea]
MKYSDIEAYPEHAFTKYWRSLLADPHFLEIIKSLGKHSASTGRKWLENGREMMSGIRSSVDFHRMMVRLVETVVDHTTEGLSFSGIENIPQDRGVCFLSNHRSTSLDPAFVNAVLYKNFTRTAYNAAGDNIFKTNWLGHLIRLNRGFIVRRDVDDIDEKRAEAQKLSGYINTLLEDKQWVWIAHRNGRSKDGWDQTDSAVLTMLKMDRPDASWQDYTETNALVPVSISWELIPLDILMAKELCDIPTYHGPQRDMKNIVTEIGMKKKRVHIHFSSPVTAEKRAQLVRGTDAGIQAGQTIWPANWVAAQELNPDLDLPESVDANQGMWILQRADELEQSIAAEGHSFQQALAVRTTLLRMYARPVLKTLLS